MLIGYYCRDVYHTFTVGDFITAMANSDRVISKNIFSERRTIIFKYVMLFGSLKKPLSLPQTQKRKEILLGKSKN